MSGKLLFDLSACQELSGGPHGGSEYGRSVLEHLLGTVDTARLELFFDPGRKLPAALEARLGAAGVPAHAVTGCEELQSLLRQVKPSRFYSALASFYDIDFGDIEIFLTIHGLRPIELPYDSRMLAYADTPRRLTKDSLRIGLSSLYKRYRVTSFYKLVHLKCRRQTIIVPSQHTKYALLCWYPDLMPDSVKVLASPPTAVCDTEPKQLGFGLQPEEYFLIVGGKRWVKNGYRAMRAFEWLTERLPPARRKQLVVLGGAPWRIPGRWRELYTFLPYVDEPTLASLYANAFCLLYPTLNEGFGYPPLEAMRFGTPVIASAICSLTEILGDAACYINPRDECEIANRCYQIIDRPEFRDLLKEKGRAQYAEMRGKQEADLKSLTEMLLNDL